MTTDTDETTDTPAMPDTTTVTAAAPVVDLPALLAAAEAILPAVLPVRRQIHRHPEIGLDLPVTQAAIAEDLRSLGLRPRLGVKTTSVTAVIEGDRPGPTVLLRADMDALPLQEDTGLDFRSAIDGTMHACGHDTHVAMLLGAARLLVERRAELAGRALLMFQPGEEGYAGAQVMLDEGLLDAAGPGALRPSRAFAIHISNQYATGTINVRPGPQLASADQLWITVTGRGGHASRPSDALDPITVAAEIVLALQTMVTRRIDVWDPVVVTIAQIHGGTTNNIIPETAVLNGTIRTVSVANRERVQGLIRQVAEGIGQAHGAGVAVAFVPGYPVTINDAGAAARARRLGAGLVGEGRVHEPAAPVMGAEDFSYVLEQVPGAMAFLGARPADLDPDTAPQNHSNRVVFDEAAMAVGIALYAAEALEP